MAKYRDLDSGDVFPAYWTDAIQEFTGTIVSGLRLTLASANTVRAAAGTNSEQVAVGVSGLFRYRSTNADIVISGTTGTYNLYAVASDNSIIGVTDSTDYNWYLLFGTTPPTGTIPGAGTIFATRKVGEVDWDDTASAITGLRQLVGGGDTTQPVTPTSPRATVTPLVVRGTTAQTAPLVSAGSSSSATDRLTLDAGGKLSLPVTGTSGGLLLGGDATLYRSGSNTLRTGGGLTVDGAASANAITSSTSVSSASAAVSGNATVGGNLTVSGTLTPSAINFAAITSAIDSKTSNYTLVLGDKDKFLEMNVASANTVTIPADASVNFPVGSEVNVVQVGVGQTTIAGAGGVTVNATPSLQLRSQWSSVTLVKRAANSWLVVGDLAVV